MKSIRMAACAAGLALLVPVAAQAQDEEEEATGAWELDAEVGLFSDYRFRGVSLSGKDPEVTAEVSVAHESGFYAGTWVSNVDLGSGNDDIEVDLYAGFATDLGGLTVDVGALYYLYPSDGSLDYIELTGSVGATVGPADLTLGVAYAPSQGALGNTDNTYVYVSGEVPLSDRSTLFGTFGIEDGAFGNSKRDWTVGVAIDVGSGFTISGAYVDTARAFSPLADATGVFSITKSF